MDTLPAKVVIIDDEERIRQLLVDYLDDFDEFLLRAFESAEAALEQIAQETVDLCVVDMRLPGMDGQEFILTARRRGLCEHFILHTGSVDFILTEQLLAAGVREDDVFFKPCDIKEMHERICQILKLPGV